MNGTTSPRSGDLGSLSLAELARRIRVGTIVSIYHARSGHPGGALSMAELLAYLWGRELGYRPGKIVELGQNRFVLSKGHGCPALNAAMAEAGLLERAELCKLRKLASRLQGHPCVHVLPEVETSTGSLGQGFSFAIGLALGLRQRRSNARVYGLIGDGEMQEGEVWEGAMFAGHYKLDNLCVAIDYNRMQSDDLNANVMTLEPLRAKWEAFNWRVVEIDGHDLGAIETAFEEAKGQKGRPTAIIAHTLKGKGVSYMEGSPLWHGSVRLSDGDLCTALRDLGVPPSGIDACRDESIGFWCPER